MILCIIHLWKKNGDVFNLKLEYPINKFTNRILIALSIFSGFLVSSCDSKIEVKPKNIYEEAVYSSSRPETDKEQDKKRKPAEVLEFARIKPGMVVADLSAGTGYYSELFSYMVGSKGKVYLQNKPEYLSREKKKLAIENRLKANRLPNVELISSSFGDLALPSKVDLIFLSKIFHDLYVPEESEQRNQAITLFIDEISQYLKVDGLLVIIDHSAPIGSKASSTSKTHRIDEIHVKNTFESKGYELLDTSDILRNKNDARNLSIWDNSIFKNTDQFVYIFRKK